jgi:hypothetical protein
VLEALSFAFGMFWEIMWALILGWQFTVAEFVGGPLMIVLVAIAFRVLLRRRLVKEARQQADRACSAGWRGTPRWTCRSARAGRSGNDCAHRMASPPSRTPS